MNEDFIVRHTAMCRSGDPEVEWEDDTAGEICCHRDADYRLRDRNGHLMTIHSVDTTQGFYWLVCCEGGQ